jgi:hypothetical protein
MLVVAFFLALATLTDRSDVVERWRAEGESDAVARNLSAHHAGAVASIAARGSVTGAIAASDVVVPAWYRPMRTWNSEVFGSAVLTWADQAVLDSEPSAVFSALQALGGEQAFVVDAPGTARLATGVAVGVPAGIPVGAVGLRSSWQ